MKLFVKPLLSWTEPTFFPARTRDRRGWMLRGLLALVIFIAMMIAFYYDRHGGRGPRFSPGGAVLLSAFIGVFLTAALDAPSFSRQVTISDDNINYFGNAGMEFSAGSWPLRSIHSVRLYPPEELGRSFGAMEVRTARGTTRLGVPAKLALERIAQVLHEQGISVVLPGWEPRVQEPEPAAVEVPTRPMPSTSARVETLSAPEAGRIMSPRRLGVAAAMAFAPLIIPLIAGLGLAGLAIYRWKVLGARASLTDAAAGLGGLVLIIGGFWYALRLSNLLPSLYLRAVARSIIEQRPDTLLDPRDTEVVFIDVVPRANWGKVALHPMSDTGFLKIDPVSRCLLFEGDRERWRIPAASLVSVEVESHRPPGHVEGQEGEVFYRTVVKARLGDQVWEAPMTPAHVELRPRDNARRQVITSDLRDRIRSLRPADVHSAGRSG